jgi:hypothetical protein
MKDIQLLSGFWTGKNCFLLGFPRPTWSLAWLLFVSESDALA